MNNIQSVDDIKFIKSDYIKPVQSANVLLKFMTKIKYLKNVLKNKAFIPRYCEEDIEYIKINQLERIAFPMICFCDIHMQRVKYHCEGLNEFKGYGNYGLGMNKKWGIRNGIQPLHYINDNSDVIKSFSYLFNKSLENIYYDLESYTQEYDNYLLESLLYLKPIQGKMRRNDEYVEKNFHDEREWRYIPNIEQDDKLNLIITKSEFLNENSYKTHSGEIEKRPHLWLDFEYSDIKYVFIEREKERIDLVNFIINELCCDIKEKYVLISKIVVLDSIEEDL